MANSVCHPHHFFSANRNCYFFKHKLQIFSNTYFSQVIINSELHVLAYTQEALQFLLNIAVDDNNILERYHTQPTKSILLHILNSSRHSTSVVFRHATQQEVSMVSETLHMRIPRSGNRPNQESIVKENIAKAQRTLYNLMASRLYGENGLDLKLALIYCRYVSSRYWSTVFMWSYPNSL